MESKISYQSDMYENIFMIYKRINRYDFNISYDFIEHIRTNPEYDGLYQLLEIFISERIGCAPNNPILLSSPYDIIHDFAAVYNIKIVSIFDIKKNTEQLTAIFYKVHVDLAKSTICGSHANILKLLHDKISEQLGIAPIYNILLNDTYNKILIDIESQRYSREELDIKIDETAKLDADLPINYINFAYEKYKLLAEGADIQAITGCIDMLFTQENIHPILKKYTEKFLGVVIVKLGLIKFILYLQYSGLVSYSGVFFYFFNFLK